MLTYLTSTLLHRTWRSKGATSDGLCRLVPFSHSVDSGSCWREDPEGSGCNQYSRGDIFSERVIKKQNESDHRLEHVCFTQTYPLYLLMCHADELDPLWHRFVLNKPDGDALFDHLLHVVFVVCRTKLDVVVHGRQLDVFVLLKDAAQGFGFVFLRCSADSFVYSCFWLKWEWSLASLDVLQL